MNNKLKYLSKNFLLFAISGFGPKLLVFLMVPLYTRCLSAAEYGIADILTSTAGLMVPFLLLVIEDAVMRFCMDASYKPGEVLTNAMIVLARGMAICAGVLFLVLLLPLKSLNPQYLLYLLLLIGSNGIYQIFINFLRGIDKINVFVEASLITTLVSCLLNIVLLVFLHLGINGYLIAQLGGTLCASIWIVFRIRIWCYISRKNISPVLRRDMERFSMPLILNKVGWWINNVSDRYVVIWLAGAAANGIYSVAYKIPTILTTCSGIFAQAWQISAIREFDPKDKNSFIRDMYELYHFFLVICCSTLLIFNIPIARLLYANDFFAAWKYVPPLLISVVFGGLSGFIGSLFMAVKDTKIFSQSTLIGAGVNIALNIILVYIMGPLGAAIATMISYFIIWLIRLCGLKKYMSFHPRWARILTVDSLLLIQMIISMQGFGVSLISLQVVVLVIILALQWKYLKKAAKMLYSRLHHKSSHN